MTGFNTCRFCQSMMSDNLVKYGTRHYAHFDCYLDAGKKLGDLPAWQVEKFPYFMLKDRNLLEEAAKILETRRASSWPPRQQSKPLTEKQVKRMFAAKDAAASR